MAGVLIRKGNQIQAVTKREGRRREDTNSAHSTQIPGLGRSMKSLVIPYTPIYSLLLLSIVLRIKHKLLTAIHLALLSLASVTYHSPCHSHFSLPNTEIFILFPQESVLLPATGIIFLIYHLQHVIPYLRICSPLYIQNLLGSLLKCSKERHLKVQRENLKYSVLIHSCILYQLSACYGPGTVRVVVKAASNKEGMGQTQVLFLVYRITSWEKQTISKGINDLNNTIDP